MPTATKSHPSILDNIQYAATSNKIIPLLFAVDCSGSMGSKAIDSEGRKQRKIEGVMQGLQGGIAYLRRAPELKDACRVGILTFESNIRFDGFQPLDQIAAPKLSPNGATAFCGAMNRCADELFRFYADMNKHRLTAAMSTIVVITDGEPTDGAGHEEVKRLVDLHNSRKAFVWAVGIDDQDRSRLEQLGFPPTQVVTVEETSWPHIIQLGTMSAAAIARGQMPLSCNLMGGAP